MWNKDAKCWREQSDFVKYGRIDANYESFLIKKWTARHPWIQKTFTLELKAISSGQGDLVAIKLIAPWVSTREEGRIGVVNFSRISLKNKAVEFREISDKDCCIGTVIDAYNLDRKADVLLIFVLDSNWVFVSEPKVIDYAVSSCQCIACRNYKG